MHLISGTRSGVLNTATILSAAAQFWSAMATKSKYRQAISDFWGLGLFQVSKMFSSADTSYPPKVEGDARGWISSFRYELLSCWPYRTHPQQIPNRSPVNDLIDQKTNYDTVPEALFPTPILETVLSIFYISVCQPFRLGPWWGQRTTRKLHGKVGEEMARPTVWFIPDTFWLLVQKL